MLLCGLLWLTGCGRSSSRAAAGKAAAAPKFAALRVEPTNCFLNGKWASQVLLPTGQRAEGAWEDVTASAQFRSANPKIAEVDASGVVRPRGNGLTTIFVAVGKAKAQVTVTVTNAGDDAVSFVRDVMPVLDHLGCNAAACHGSRAGKGGFKLSLFAAQPDHDYIALTKSARGRRANKAEPEQSLFLRKATLELAHEGGQRLHPGSAEYSLLLAWVAQGACGPDESEPKLVSLTVSSEALMLKKGEGRRLLVRGVFSDGAERDVTSLAAFKSDDTNVVVAAGDRMQAVGLGETALLVTYGRRSVAVRATVPQSLPMPFPPVPANNKIDELVAARLKALGLPPSGLCTDQEFLRRVHLDVIGTLPTPAEVSTFLSDTDPGKRSRLIDRLLEREEFADYWALKWGDLLRIKSEYPVRVWPKGVAAYYRWLRDSLARNKPYDQFARQLLTATGSNFREGPVNFVRAVLSKDPQTVAETAALLFMGARFGCARCHGHPTEPWSPADDLGLAACFAKVGYKATSEWKEEIVFTNPKGVLRDPRTKAVVKPRLPDGQAIECPADKDPRVKFADWLITPQNPWFTRNIANRVWCWLLGRGIVHEPDDLRPTNLPENPALLDYLARELAGHQYDLKHLYRLILNSRTYQLSSQPNEWNRQDTTHFSHYQVKRLGAEELIDAICQVTEVPETYSSQIPEPYTRLPADFRAVQIADGNIQSAVLELFGRPPRDTPYECERCSDPSMRQALYFLNSDHLEGKVAASPRLKRLLDAKKSDAEIIDELYLAALSRPATAAERQQVTDYLSRNKTTRAQAVQDLAWALLNTKEFLFIR